MRMINDSTDRLCPITRNFVDVHHHAATFINKVMDEVARENINLEPNFLEIRSNRRSTSPTAVDSSTRHFEISCYDVILDTVVQSIKRRFSGHKDLHKESGLAQLA